MLTFCSARAWQSLPSVPGRSSKRIVNSLAMGMVGTSLRCTSWMSWKGPARSNDVSNPTPATCLHQERNEIARKNGYGPLHSHRAHQHRRRQISIRQCAVLEESSSDSDRRSDLLSPSDQWRQAHSD